MPADGFERKQIMEIFGVTEEDMTAIDQDGYPEAKAEHDRIEAEFLREMQRRADKLLYGNCFEMADGTRIDPRHVLAFNTEPALPPR